MWVIAKLAWTDEANTAGSRDIAHQKLPLESTQGTLVVHQERSATTSNSINGPSRYCVALDPSHTKALRYWIA